MTNNTHEIRNTERVIDSRDVIARIEYLQAEKDQAEEDQGDAFNEELYGDTDEGAELKVLLALQEEASGSPDWEYGEALIHDDYFEDYARELAEDCGMVDPNAKWPNIHIDWAAAAEALKQDYTYVDFDGQDYWIRA